MSSHNSQPGVGNAHPASLLGSLPQELLEPIYILSENVDLPLVNRHFHESLTNSFIRVKFCAKVLYYGRKHEGFYFPDHLGLSSLQTQIFQHKWFSDSLAKKVEKEVIRLQRGNERANRLKGGKRMPRLLPNDRVQVAPGTAFPKELLRGPWTPGKVKLCYRLSRWGVNVAPKQALSQGMIDAIAERNISAVRLLHNKLRLPFEPHHFKLAVVNGCDKVIVETMVQANANPRRGYKFISWDDPDVIQTARGMMGDGDQQGLWLLNLMHSKGKSLFQDKYGPGGWACEEYTWYSRTFFTLGWRLLEHLQYASLQHPDE
ncbi:hypothetical protein N7G274_001609 [Stereocaulon virgatum]|uniref:F-box domain-containing protein n=1 Tax=Stereocaulon virgatum TaxID=373712 RepID=A0ABR4AK68_9LECA